MASRTNNHLWACVPPSLRCWNTKRNVMYNANMLADKNVKAFPPYIQNQPNVCSDLVNVAVSNSLLGISRNPFNIVPFGDYHTRAFIPMYFSFLDITTPSDYALVIENLEDGYLLSDFIRRDVALSMVTEKNHLSPWLKKT